MHTKPARNARKKVFFASFVLLLLTISVFSLSFSVRNFREAEPSQAALDGDCDLNNTVNVLDFQMLSNSFGKTAGQTGYRDSCDFNNNNTIDLLDFQMLSNNFGTSGNNSPTNTPSGPTPTAFTGSGIGPISLSYRQGGLWLTPTEIAQIPTNNAGWNDLVAWANKPMDVVSDLRCTAGGLSCEHNSSRVMFAKAIVGIRTNNTTMINQAKAELDRVPEAISRATSASGERDIKWGERNIPLIAVTANLLDYRPPAVKSALHFVLRQFIWDEGITVENSALRGLANKPSHGRWGLMAVAYINEDFATVNKVVQAHAKAMGERNWGGSVNTFRFNLSGLGDDDNWQTLQPGGKTDPIGIMPAGVFWNGHGVGGLYLADQYRAGNGPVWVPQHTNYTYEGLGPHIAIAFSADHLGFRNVFQLGNYALLRTLLFHYSAFDGKPSWPAQTNDLWEIAAVMTWAKPVFGTSLPSNLKPEPDANVPWPLPVTASSVPGRSMGFMYATHYARLAL